MVFLWILIVGLCILSMAFLGFAIYLAFQEEDLLGFLEEDDWGMAPLSWNQGDDKSSGEVR